mmetsp:Transcript_12268/g.33732  ORF Transcript_12268/g.33732 Transcript_12268/m.33732 type:complete len:205 (-) Transcript_12268:152-766(-)|eukprot:CAMPEP_0198118396 /NCGR_PEP_ID=MMETSP1442-20131203/21540_1 /TAXON_ID= /ORGANISM="Craspedostauros australis, Strain CCMP3328" /LENGTH=204 /DNA_ID=CAMNT_0043776649 /DNA_START=160 /DNA_END=774 /DNA_ORIENTATION=-
MTRSIRRCIFAASLLSLHNPAQAWQIPLPGGGRIRLDNSGVLRIQLQDQEGLPPFPAMGSTADDATLQSLDVRDTGTPKGFGVFATTTIAQHAFLGFYPGNRITSREKLDEMVASGATNMDYVIGVDGGQTFLDGYEWSKTRDQFCPVFLNHADGDEQNTQANCLRLLEDGEVAFFTARQIQAGEELCFDYGSNYWVGREQQKI